MPDHRVEFVDLEQQDLDGGRHLVRARQIHRPEPLPVCDFGGITKLAPEFGRQFEIALRGDQFDDLAHDCAALLDEVRQGRAPFHRSGACSSLADLGKQEDAFPLAGPERASPM